MGSFSLALNSNPLAGSLLLIACTAFLRSGWYHLLLLLPSTGKACKKSLSCARKSIPRALDGCCKNKTKSCPSLAQKIIFFCIYVYTYTYTGRERRKRAPEEPPLPADKCRGQLVPFANPGQGSVRLVWKEPLFLQLLGTLSEGAAVGSWRFQCGSGQ